MGETYSAACQIGRGLYSSPVAIELPSDLTPYSTESCPRSSRCPEPRTNPRATGLSSVYSLDPGTALKIEAVQQANAGPREIGDVSRDQGQAVDTRRRGEQAIDHRHRIGNVQPSPRLGNLGVDGKDPVRVIPPKLG